MGSGHSKELRTMRKKHYLKHHARTGDLVFFCNHGHFSALIKTVTLSNISHIGNAVVTTEPIVDNVDGTFKDADETVFLWHSPSGPLYACDVLGASPSRKDGPQLNPMRTVFGHMGSNDRVFVRQIEFIEPECDAVRVQHEWARNDGKVDEGSYLFEYMREVHQRHYEQNRQELVFSVCDGPFCHNKPNMDSVFCSELVAHTLYAGAQPPIMDTTVPSNEFTPANFLEGHMGDDLINKTGRVRYGPLIELVRGKGKK